ncbi:transcriptional regulator [Microtetraspora sp. NBRC 13810]|uniref:winged helix-turn-helix transcriptional regulator n=1 Tax=Microtetraspora sp. NBRC 13810 TaxID=3030990 RepID=UPI0024A018BF|nr:helix-turn-helix domain-containing protein [Microtetraspora sp. NBRC 13810]GLW06807.1 transcriptional regulator [Microtetraspora sp. NBRC 13810]
MGTQTAAERRDAERAGHRVRAAACPTNRVLDRIGDKWVGLVLKELAGGPRRYGDLARAIVGASQKMLTQTLRHLERDGLVSRAVTPAVPARVDYALTPLGETLLPVLGALTEWAEEHIGEIDAARETYDAPGRRPPG